MPAILGSRQDLICLLNLHELLLSLAPLRLRALNFVRVIVPGEPSPLRRDFGLRRGLRKVKYLRMIKRQSNCMSSQLPGVSLTTKYFGKSYLVKIIWRNYLVIYGIQIREFNASDVLTDLVSVYFATRIREIHQVRPCGPKSVVLRLVPHGLQTHLR